MKILFLHGWHSVPGGVKPTYLIQHGHQIINPALPDDQFDEAVKIAQAEFDQHRPNIIVGSSRGGAVAMAIKSSDTPLVLLCPAWKRWGTATVVKRGTTILHSSNDEAIAFADSQELTRISGLPETALIETGNDHRLADAASLRAMLDACLAARPRFIGCDFGVPKKAGDQARKIILIEAVKLGSHHYAIEPNGRNARLVHEFIDPSPWKTKRRGWTLPDLVYSLSADPSVKLAAFDFPFSLPISLLRDTEFARLLNQPPFETRDAWTTFVSDRLRLAFDDDSAGSELQDLAFFAPWKDKTFWLRRETDVVTKGSPPLKHKFQNIFAMTIAGNAFLNRLKENGHTILLDSTTLRRLS